MHATSAYAPPTNPQRSGWPGFPWTFLAAIFALSLPLWILGYLTDARLMPGLPVSALMFVCPAIVAGAFAYRIGGMHGVRELLARVFDARRIKSVAWYAPMVLLMPGVLGATYAAMRIAGLPLPEPRVAWLQTPILFLVFFVAAAGEELAWSATVLDPLQDRLGALRAAVIIGVVGALWHAIPFSQVHPSVTWILGQTVFMVAFRVVLVWLYNGAGRSVFAVIVFHAMYNVAWQLFPNQGSGYNPWIAAAITVLVAVVLVALRGARTLTGRASSPGNPACRTVMR